ncbi:MAG: hypothetical protein Q9227_003851 [Pyrenula ochraceoflavens]
MLTNTQGELNAPQEVITCKRKSVGANAVSFRLPQCIPMNPTQFGAVSSLYTLGGLIGALLAGPVATKYGRLRTMRLTTTVFILGPVGEALAPSIAVMSVGRFLSGIGAGAATVVGPIYVSEVAPPESKAFYGAFTQIMTNFGIFLAQLLGYFLSHDDLWRTILGVAGFIGFVQFLGLFLVPETPKWLAEHGRATLAQRILRRIRGEDANLEEETRDWKLDSEAEEEQALLATTEQASAVEESNVSIGRAFASGKYRPALIAVMVVMITQQLTGINSVVMYSVSILSSILPTSAALLTVILSVVNIIVTTLCAPLGDKIGRKPSLLLSIAGMGTSAMLLAIGLTMNIKILSAVATLTFVASFAVGLGPIPFILASELVGPEAVGAAQSCALAANWISTFLVAQFFPILNSAMGGQGRVFLIFTAMAVVLGSFIAWYLPETKGKANADEVWSRESDRRRLD